jgi:hypothetical protein
VITQTYQSFFGVVVGKQFLSLLNSLEILLISLVFVLVYCPLVVFLLFLVKNSKLSVSFFVLGLLIYLHLKTHKIRSMAVKKLWKFATPNDDYHRATITQPMVTAENYEIKPDLNLV